MVAYLLIPEQRYFNFDARFGISIKSRESRLEIGIFKSDLKKEVSPFGGSVYLLTPFPTVTFLTTVPLKISSFEKEWIFFHTNVNKEMILNKRPKLFKRWIIEMILTVTI